MSRRTSRDLPVFVLDRRPPVAAAPPTLDTTQSAVAAHVGGPLLVLAGPGTGKTTTLVKAMVARLRDPAAAGGLTPESVLGLTFGRRAAAEWRDRVVARTGGGPAPTVMTFHAFAYALVRSLTSDDQVRPLRLLSGPEQESRLRELLRHAVAEGRVPWPPDLAEAMGTRGLAAEVRAVVARARALGLDPDDLVTAGRAASQPAWESVGRFLGEYLDVLDAEGVADYTELMLRAVLLAEQPDVGTALRRRFRAVYVDEYQDTDPMQVRLLQAIVDPGTTLIAVGDPDQAIYGFRGADVRGLLGFRSTFRDRQGNPAPLAILGHTRRFGPVLRTAASGLLGDRVPRGLTLDEVRRHRHPQCVVGAHGPGSVEILVLDDRGAEAAHIADLVRRAVLDSRRHRDDGPEDPGGAAEPVEPLAWNDIAVVVRSGVRQIPTLRRALLAAGVPVDVAGDEVPLREEPALAPLLEALRWAAGHEAMTPALAGRLLVSPLGGVDPADLRRLARALRRAARDSDPDRPAPPSAQLVAEALDDPRLLLSVERAGAGGSGGAGSAVHRVGDLLRSARDAVHGGRPPADVLWLLWSGTGWPTRLERAALRGGPAGRRADRDLDAVLALFDAAERAAERGGVKGMTSFLAELDDQEIPADSLAEKGVRPDAVRLLTAHRAKGLEWRLVVVAGVQEGTWPDLRRRGTLLAADRLGKDGIVDPPRAADLLAEERRLFYVACTRARERLVVTAVEGGPDDPAADQPSRFLTDLDGAVRRRLHGRPARALSASALVAALRRAAADPESSDTLRRAAAERLAVIGAASATTSAIPVTSAFAFANPARWWGVLPSTPGTGPVRPEGAPLALSGSAVAAVEQCALRWFLGREASGDVVRVTAMGFGSVVHVVADAVGRGVLPDDIETLDAVLDRVWSALGYEAAWHSDRERAAARAALVRFLAWHRARERQLVGTEVPFDVHRLVPGPDGALHPVQLRGSMDVVEVDDHGRAVVLDLKTGSVVPSARQTERHPQLAVYQAAVDSGAVPAAAAVDSGAVPTAAAVDSGDVPADAPATAGGAGLVMLRRDATKGSALPKVLVQQAPDGAGMGWIDELIGDVAARIRAEDFRPSPGDGCRTCAFTILCPARPEGAEVLS